MTGSATKQSILSLRGAMDCFASLAMTGLRHSGAARRAEPGISRFPGMTTTRFVEVVPKRSPVLTIFWHCGFGHFSSRTGFGARARQQTVNGFGRGCGSKGSGNADSQRKLRSPGWSGQCRPRPGDSGCVPAHPAYRRAASYLPLRAGWAVCAWALRGCVEIARPFRAQTAAHH